MLNVWISHSFNAFPFYLWHGTWGARKAADASFSNTLNFLLFHAHSELEMQAYHSVTVLIHFSWSLFQSILLYLLTEDIYERWRCSWTRCWEEYLQWNEAGRQRKLNNEEPHNLYFSSDIIGMINSEGLRWSCLAKITFFLDIIHYLSLIKNVNETKVMDNLQKI
jgi:hypothetical protein